MLALSLCFEFKGALKQHIKKDCSRKIKDHNCPHCDLISSFGPSIKQHIKAFHKKCSQCDYMTSWKAALKKHVKSVHGKNRG